MKRTLKRESKELEIVEMDAFAFSGCHFFERQGGFPKMRPFSLQKRKSFYFLVPKQKPCAFMVG